MNTTTVPPRIIHKHTLEREKKKLLFDMVCDQDNWKKPIHCIIPKENFQEFNDSVIFFTAGGLRVLEDDGDYLICKAGGYYEDCGA